MCGVIVARDGTLIDFCVAYDYDRSGGRLDKGIGWISRWAEVPEEKIGYISTGHPNSWAQDRIISQTVFALEGQGGLDSDG